MGGGYPTDLDPRSESFEHIVRSHRDVYEDAADNLRAFMGGEGSAEGDGVGVSADATRGVPAAGEVARRW